MAAETVVNAAPLYTGSFQFPLRPDDFVAVTGIGCYTASASMIGGLALAEWSFIANFNYDGIDASWGLGDPGIDLDAEDSAGITVRDLADAARVAMTGYAEIDFATYWLHRYYCQAGVPGEGGEAQFRWVVSTHVVEDGAGVWVYGPESMDLSWSLTVSDLRLWRDITADPPPKRSHMHPVDAEAEDYWVVGPDCQLIATIGGLTAAVAYDALSEGVVVTPAMMAGWQLDFGGGVQGVLENGTSYFHMGLGGGGAPLAAPDIDEQAFDQDLSTRVEEVDVVGGAGGWDLLPNENYTGYAIWAGTMNPPLIIGYDIDLKLFPGTAGSPSYDPLIWDGFQDSSGTPEPRLASTLPSSVAIAQVSWSTDLPFKSDRKFAPRLDEDWAATNQFNPAAVADVAGDEEAQNDLFLGVHASPRNKWPVDDPWQVVATLAAVNSPILPILGTPAATGEGVAISGSSELTLAVPDGVTGGIVLNLTTPYWTRLGLLGQLDVEKNWRWPYALDVEAGVQDAVNWDSHAYLQLVTTRPAAGPLALALKLKFKEAAIYDPHYTSGAWRAREFTWSSVEREVTYTGVLADGETTINFDLLCPDDGSIPWLFIVEQVTIDGFVGPAEGEDAYVISTLRLVGDQGNDHTGRDNGSTARMLSKSTETWDFLADWESTVLQRDGCLTVARFPGEPWANAGPERGFGYIEAWQHSPDYTGPASLLHFARPFTEFGLIGGKLGLDWALTANYEAMHQDGEGRSIGVPMMYWASNEAQIEPTGGPAWSIEATPHVTTWNLALGVPYVCRVRKIVGCGAHGLVKTATGRLTQDLVPETATFYVYKRVDGAAWSLLTYGDLADQIDQHGIFTSPGLLQGRTSTDGVESVIDHWIVLWADNDFAYDVNDPADLILMRAHTDFIQELQLNGATRRWSEISPNPLTLGSNGNLVRLRVGPWAVTRGGYVWTRDGYDKPWVRRTATASPTPLLLRVWKTDGLSVLERTPRRSITHGQLWEPGLIDGAPLPAGLWRRFADLTEARMSRHDLIGLCVGTRRVGSSTSIIAGGMSDPAVTLATIPDATLDGETIYPWIHRLITGVWLVGAFINGSYYEWRSEGLDELTFEQTALVEVGDHCKLSNTSFWPLSSATEVVAGYHAGAGQMVVLSRQGVNGEWSGPDLQVTADEAQPYCCENRLGSVEVGWLADDAWVQYEADKPAGPWSLR